MKSVKSILKNISRRLTWAASISAIAVFGLLLVARTTNLDILGNTFGGSVAAANQNASGYGFSTSLDGLSGQALNSKLSAMKATGATWVRYDLSWDSVQSAGPDSYDWSASDEATTAAVAHGFKVLMIIDFVPSWARESSCTDSKMCPPGNAGAYGTFAAAAVRHYKPMGIEDWEIWNEPNISFRFHPASNPQQYVDMLKAAYTDIKQVDPASVVIAGSTAPSATDQGNYAPSDFLKAMYADGARGYFDAISAHPYTYPITPSQSSPADAWGQLWTMQQIMATNGDANKQIWVTEFGAPTNGQNIPGDHVSEATQAQIVTEAISQLHTLSWAGPFFWYDYQDSGTSLSDSQNFFGLVRANGSFKPAYYAFTKAVAKYSN